MQPVFSDETLMAFADGALDEPLFSQVAEALEQDEGLATRLEALVQGGQLARQGFEPLLQAVPPELERSVRSMAVKAQKPRRKWQRNWLLPVAGFATAAAAVAVAMPFLQMPATPLSGFGGSELVAALNSLPSGGDEALADGGNVHMVASFIDAGGALCREFETESHVVVACRGDADWDMAFALAVAPGDGGYQPASGLEALDAYLDSVGAAAPLLDEAEAAALARLR